MVEASSTCSDQSQGLQIRIGCLEGYGWYDIYLILVSLVQNQIEYIVRIKIITLHTNNLIIFTLYIKHIEINTGTATSTSL